MFYSLLVIHFTRPFLATSSFLSYAVSLRCRSHFTQMIRLISLTQVSRWNPAELCRVKMKHCNTDQIANSRIYGRRGPSAILHRILSLRHQWIYIYWKYAAFRCTVRSWSLCLKKFSVRNSAQFCGYRFFKEYLTRKKVTFIFRSTSKSRPNNIRGGNVRPSVRPQKVSSIWMKFGI